MKSVKPMLEGDNYYELKSVNAYGLHRYHSLSSYYDLRCKLRRIVYPLLDRLEEDLINEEGKDEIN